MRYADCHILSEHERRAWQSYVADSLRVITENTAKYAGGGYIRERWVDIVSPKKKDTRTGEEIVADVIKKSGLKVVSRAEPV